MTYVSTQKPDAPVEQSMSLEELKQGLLEITTKGTERISRSELIKIITTMGDKLTLTEATQVLSLIPTVNGVIEISSLIDKLHGTFE
ncbi:hypothetical protein NERG_02050 [Nematocida ausubeli]|uniref:EF-hand domain-containing protein n=1 Tax=Nematocida ausubeli (strain ATCC PRA-371 / ERTm2) TaxID=1913371 RepID=H8ZEM9_NEMA1|nr:hypothetical protein NERG_02050 [Nematocida ausubeli]